MRKRIGGKAIIFRVDDIWDEAKKTFGICEDAKVFRLLGDAASLVCNKADLEGLKGFLDICSVGCSCSGERPCCNTCGKRCLTLPREVETVIAVNIGGKPALGFAQLFNFHQNGPGDCCTGCDFSWMDLGKNFSTYKDLITPAKLVVYTQTAEDDNLEFIVYGYDGDGNVLRRQVAGEWKNGLAIPTIFGAAIPDSDAPTVARITGIFKQASVGSMRLSTIDDSGTTGVLLGVYEPDETVPQFRRIQLNRSCGWARVAFLKSSPIFHSRYDHIPLMSRRAFLLACRAVKSYEDLQLPEAHAFEADAARLEVEAQMKLDAPLYFPIQVVDRNSIRDKSDYWIE